LDFGVCSVDSELIVVFYFTEHSPLVKMVYLYLQLLVSSLYLCRAQPIDFDLLVAQGVPLPAPKGF
jgi:hypothetical protein